MRWWTVSYKLLLFFLDATEFEYTSTSSLDYSYAFDHSEPDVMHTSYFANFANEDNEPLDYSFADDAFFDDIETLYFDLKERYAKMQSVHNHDHIIGENMVIAEADNLVPFTFPMMIVAVSALVAFGLIGCLIGAYIKYDKMKKKHNELPYYVCPKSVDDSFFAVNVQ